MNDSEFLRLLAVHAPPVPDWFEPVMPDGTTQVESERQRQRLYQWPVAYSHEVFRAEGLDCERHMKALR
jgi:hypothetical protein